MDSTGYESKLSGTPEEPFLQVIAHRTMLKACILSIVGDTHLACNASTTHLAVDEGKTQLQRLADGATVQVGAGQFSAVTENEPLAARLLPPAGQGTGLLGEYFSWGSFEKPTFRRIDPQVRFDWGASRPGQGLNEDHFQVRWTGAVHPKFTERYLFELVADDRVRLWVDGQLLVDQWVIRSRQTSMRGEITLQAGRKYDLKLDSPPARGSAARPAPGRSRSGRRMPCKPKRRPKVVSSPCSWPNRD